MHDKYNQHLRSIPLNAEELEAKKDRQVLRQNHDMKITLITSVAIIVSITIIILGLVSYLSISYKETQMKKEYEFKQEKMHNEYVIKNEVIQNEYDLKRYKK